MRASRYSTFKINRLWYSLLGIIIAFSFSGCFTLPLDTSYPGPPVRPESLEEYYSVKNEYSDVSEEHLVSKENFDIKRITLETLQGKITITYYRRHEKSPNLILVFPLLGGKNVVVDYFANYFAHHGYDSAIIHRNDDFKDPTKFDQLEEIFRQSVLRDRIALNFFEKVYAKTTFGSFGISRGAINVVMTAGVDPRLKYNVIAMGASDIAKTIKRSNQGRLKKYVRDVMAQKHISESEFYRSISETLKTDPKKVAKYIDARHTLMFLALLDKTVPIQYGLKLRRQIGKPKTVFVFGDHYLSVLYSGIRKVLPRPSSQAVFPLDYIESESMTFYDKMFKNEDHSARMLPFRIVQYPFSLLGQAIDWIF